MNKLYIFCAVAILVSVGLGDDVTTFSSECFNITGVISLNITYNGADEKLDSYVVTVTKAATLESNCNETIGKPWAKISEGGNDLTILFDINRNSTKLASMEPKHWGVSKITYDYTISKADVHDMGKRQATAVGSFFVTPINSTYSCSKQSVKLENVTMSDNGTDIKVAGEFVSLDESALTVSIGNTSAKTEYDYHYCKNDQKVKDIVPIAVGVALAALVVIVLVAYLIGRRRTVAAGGYERV